MRSYAIRRWGSRVFPTDWSNVKYATSASYPLIPEPDSLRGQAVELVQAVVRREIARLPQIDEQMRGQHAHVVAVRVRSVRLPMPLTHSADRLSGQHAEPISARITSVRMRLSITDSADRISGQAAEVLSVKVTRVVIRMPITDSADRLTAQHAEPISVKITRI